MKIEIWNWTAYLWDCLEVMKEIPDNSIDCIITDPPYWNIIDAEMRKRGEQTGLDTLVVHALNDVH